MRTRGFAHNNSSPHTAMFVDFLRKVHLGNPGDYFMVLTGKYVLVVPGPSTFWTALFIRGSLTASRK